MRDLLARFLAEKVRRGETDPETGIAVAVIKGGKTVVRECLGLRDRKAKLPVTEDTLFSVSSLAKSVSATAMLKLQDSGRIDLHRPINQDRMILPLQDAEATKSITWLDILCHRTGIPSHDLLWILPPPDHSRLMSAVQHLEAVPGAFRKSFIYNNIMYSSLLLAVREVADEEFCSFVDREIFRPLGMTSATFSSKKAQASANLALPYAKTQLMKWQKSDIIQPAGGLFASLRDMSRWLEAFATGDFLSRASHELMFAEHSRIDTPNPLIFMGHEWLGQKLSYGLGWFVGEIDGHRAYFHMGLIDGFSKSMVLIPELELGFVALANTNLSPIAGQLVQRLYEASIGREPKAEPELTPPPPTLEANPAPPFVAPNASITGVFENAAYGSMRVQVSDDAQPSIRYYDHQWPLTFSTSPASNEATFTVEAFGLQIPIPVILEKELSIPLSLDPRVGPQIFSRTSSRGPGE